MKKNRIKYLLQQHVQHKLTKAEFEELEEGLKNGAYDTEFDSIFQEVWDEKQVFNTKTSEASQVRIQQVMERIKQKRKVRYLSPMLYIASSIIIIFSFIKWGAPLLNDSQNPEYPSILSQTVTVPYGEKKKIALPDSSIVILNSGSSISYTSEFNDKLREVKLDGEAFFEVKKNISKPFRITVKNTYIEVLGTSFNVKSFPEDTALAVTVNTGKVEIGKMTENKQKNQIFGIIMPKQRLIYDYEHDIIQIDSIENVSQQLSWTNQTINFDNMELVAIAQILERWYNVDITFQSNKSKTKRYSGEFNNLPLKKVLEILKLSSSFHYNIKNNHIIID